MKVNKEYYSNYILNKISGSLSGILSDSVICIEPSKINVPMYLFLDGRTPNHTYVISGNVKSTFHLCGYGTTMLDAQMRFIGEAVERYSLVTSEYSLQNKIPSSKLFIGSYKNLQKNNFEVALECEYLNHYDEDARKYWNKKSHGKIKNKVIDKNETIKWVNLRGMDNIKRWYPWNQVFITSFEYATYHTFSTGTACHENIEKAKLSSIIENFQIDGFMYSWYTQKNKNYFTYHELPLSIKNEVNKTLNKYILNTYNLYFFDYSKNTSMNLHNLGIFLIAKNEDTYPNIVFGNQSELTLTKTIVRGLQEALAVFSIFSLNPVNDYDNNKSDNIDNLDDNVKYYAQGGKIRNKNLHEIFKNSKKLSIEKVQELSEVTFTSNEIFLWTLKNYPETAFLEIIPDWLDLPQMNVVRCVMPKLLDMCFPSFPKVNHPRLKNERIIKVPHALP